MSTVPDRPDPGHRVAMSVDLEEWFHSRRWIDGQQAHRVPDTSDVLRRIYGAPVPAGEVLPPETPTTTLQSVTLAETYVTRGGPTRGAVDRNIGRLSIRPVTHPNQILVNQPFQIQILFDGQPLANTALVVYAAGEPETDLDRFAPTDASGTATVTLDQSGQYILAARHRANAPAGAAAAIQSYTTTLTFDVMTTMPTIEEPPVQERPRRRRF